MKERSTSLTIAQTVVIMVITFRTPVNENMSFQLNLQLYQTCFYKWGHIHIFVVLWLLVNYPLLHISIQILRLFYFII